MFPYSETGDKVAGCPIARTEGQALPASAQSRFLIALLVVHATANADHEERR
jgi:hypothetical protein